MPSTETHKRSLGTSFSVFIAWLALICLGTSVRNIEEGISELKASVEYRVELQEADNRTLKDLRERVQFLESRK